MQSGKCHSQSILHHCAYLGFCSHEAFQSTALGLGEVSDCKS